MNRIRLLPEQVANQIAAGEVVERPASVVKELVENALDAQAERIQVEVQAGGRSLIRVTDDGIGMSRDDALLCFDRHATSKIRRAEDLDAISTMGFRGEALPSIASVSRLTLTTRERTGESIEATQVLIHGGKIIGVPTASGPPGTSVEVRNLFFNLPARRKFLKSEETERSHIHHYLLLAALAHPEVGFTFTHDQRLVWQLPPITSAQTASDRHAALRERLRAVYGSDLNLVAVDASAPPAPSAPLSDSNTGTDSESPENEPDAPSAIRLWGFIGAPGVSRATREDEHLFVNRRPVDNRTLHYALLEGYHTSLMKGRYPVCCLFLEIEPHLVDVNVHPTKREVKFRDDWMVRRFVTNSVRQALLAYHTPAAPGPLTHPDQIGSNAHPTANSPLEQGWIDYGAPPPNSPPPTPPAAPAPTPALPPPTAAPPSPPAVNAGSPAMAVSSIGPGLESTPHVLRPNASSLTGPTLDAAPPEAPPPPLLSVPLRFVGVIGRLYVVLESDRGLVLMDQHAAHERLLFEQMLERLERGNAPSQRLLLPETVELSPRDAVFLREHLPTLSRLGVGLSEFGERTFLLDALPPFVRTPDPRQFVLELIDGLKAAGHDVNSMRLGEDMVAKTVCRHAVKAHDPLVGVELEKLVEDLRRCAMPYTCPHGRPTLLEFSYRELEKKFGRSQ